MARKLKNVENETQILYNLEYEENKLKCEKLEMPTLGPAIC